MVEVSTSDLKSLLRMILLERKLVRVAGVCDLCGDEEKDSILSNVLCITFSHKDGDRSVLKLCNRHEGHLMTKLLKSYLKRRACKPKNLSKKMGFVGDIPKELKDGGEWEKEETSLTIAGLESIG